MRTHSLYVVSAALVALFTVACSESKPTLAPQPPTAPPAAAAQPASSSSPADLAAVRAAIDRGVDFLVKSRAADGMIGGHGGVTALAVQAIALAPSRPLPNDPRLAPTLAALVARARPDGSFADEQYPAYTTALAILALQAAGAHPELVGPAQRWLATAQLDESDGVAPTHPEYGGIGYGGKGHADLSNLHFALEALRESHFSERPETYTRAIDFLERCQNRTESNDLPGATNDGGFVYRPGDSKAGAMTSSGSMTYAGVKSFIYAGVSAEDPRVVSAIDWLRRNYTLEENPGLGQKGLYYYYQVFSRALSLLGQREFIDVAGRTHDWYGDLTRALLARQRADGSWANSDATYWESNPVLATARALLALEYGYGLATRAN
ncbi:MAG: hypothetical protein EXR73_06565 [Myxococcales bacterium]|nr:hypothetical protein [Myxococcales bacterium]